jgi:hypothetical protein
VLTKWRLPEAICTAVNYHHRPSVSSEPLKSAIVQLADMIVHSLGIGGSGELYVPYFDRKAWERFGMSTKLIKPAVEQTLHQFKDVESAFQSEQAHA